MTDERAKEEIGEPAKEEFAWGAGLSPDELAQMQRVQSIFVNRVYVRPYGGMIRISLGEVVEGTTNWHSSIVISADELIPMAELFLNQAKLTVEWVEKQRASAAQVPGDAH